MLLRYCQEITCQKPRPARRQFAAFCVCGRARPACVLSASTLRPSCVCGHPRALAAASIAWLFAFDLRVSEFEAVSYINIYFKTPKVEGVHHKRDKIRTQTAGTRKHRKQNKFLPRNIMTNLLSENNKWCRNTWFISSVKRNISRVKATGHWHLFYFILFYFTKFAIH